MRDAAVVMAMRMTGAQNLGQMTISMLRAEQGREAVLEKFNVEQTAQEMVRIYEGITQ